MPRRFQFSLARSLITVALLCVAFALCRQSLSAFPCPVFRSAVVVQAIYNPTILETDLYAAAVLDAAFGVCLALAVGVMARRTLPFLAASVIAVLPTLWLMWSVNRD